MKQTGVLFNKEMVLALLAGTKTQTRRVAKAWKDHDDGAEYRDADGWPLRDCSMDGCGDVRIAAPYGGRGDVIYAKESYRLERGLDDLSATAVAERCLDAGYRTPWAPIEYAADGARDNWTKVSWDTDMRSAEPGKLRPSIFLPKWGARIWLQIGSVRVERLQDISPDDARAEGHPIDPERSVDREVHDDAAIDWYSDLWTRINGRGSWEANPWVFVYTFRRLPCRPT